MNGEEVLRIASFSMSGKEKVVRSDAELMNELGTEEWEMVGFQDSGWDGSIYIFNFKTYLKLKYN